MRCGHFLEARDILEYGFQLSKNDNHFKSNKEKVKNLEKYYYLYKMKIIFYQENYQEVLNIYNTHFNIVNEIISPTDAFIIYCKKKVGEEIPKREDTKSYLFKQIIEYKESDFYEHIKKHLADDATNMENASFSIFVPNFPIHEVLKEIKKYIPSNQCIYPGDLENAYIFKYDECGREKYRMTNYFKVYSFHNSKDLITLTPIYLQENNTYGIPYIDLNYLKKNNKVLVKRKSQIEKFKEKYHL